MDATRLILVGVAWTDLALAAIWRAIRVSICAGVGAVFVWGLRRGRR